MTALQVVPKIAPPPGDLIRVAVPRLNKNDHIGDYLRQLETRDYDISYARVIDTKVLTCAEWNLFVTNLLTNRDWLEGKGGAGSWMFEDMEDDPDERDTWLRLTEAQRELFKKTSYLLVVKVVCGGQALYIDPEGYGYARYVAFAADNLPEGKTREQIRVEEAKRDNERKVEELKARIANPPDVPADHGIRFLWNCIKHGEEKFMCSYSMGTLYAPWPEGTVTIYAKDYHDCPQSIAQYFEVHNASDPYSDYYDKDKLRVTPNHPLYGAVKEGFEAAEAHHAKMRAKRGY